MAEYRAELVERGAREPITPHDMSFILEDSGYIPVRARSAKRSRTFEARIVQAIDEMEAI